MTLVKQLEYLRDACLEALETKIEGTSVAPLKVTNLRDDVKKWDINKVTPEEIESLYKQHQDHWLNADREWVIKASITLQGIDLSYCYSIADDVDPDLATIILYRIYRCIEVSMDVEEEFKQKTISIKNVVNGGAGPTGIELGAIQNNIGGVIQGLLPMFQSLMQSNEFKRVVERTIPKDANPSNPPDISSVVKNAMGVFESQEGKELFDKITGTLQHLPKK